MLVSTCITAHIVTPGSPSITDWISALSTSFLGGLGVVIGLWQWRASGFRPKYLAQSDHSGKAISFQITNRGRASGAIFSINVAAKLSRNEFLYAEEIHFSGFPEERFGPFTLPGLATTRIIITSDDKLSENAVIRILAGTQPGKTVKIKALRDHRMRFDGIKSLLPPGSSLS